MMAEENKPVDTEQALTEEEKLALAAIKERFSGKWKETHNENVDAFFTEMGERTMSGLLCFLFYIMGLLLLGTGKMC